MLGDIKDVFVPYYQPSLERMLKTFCGDHLMCSFADRSNRTCTGTQLSHGMEHRALDGKFIGSGRYTASITANSYLPQWISSLKRRLDMYEKDYLEAVNEEPEILTQRLASDLHIEQMSYSFNKLGTARHFVSHASCYGCLVNIPQHPLPCGHVLCANCVRDCGTRAHGKIKLEHCPLHTHTTFEPPWEITQKIDRVGIRILSLDGGGMRGIMELEVLRAIEKALGGNIRIQSFFDLIVGTSTGGINALALGVKQWSVSYCIEVFESFCNRAFIEREFRGVWGLEQAALMNHGSKYKATPLHDVLRETLGQKPLFGANDSLNAYKIKVAVTTTSADGNEAMILANYNRPRSPGDRQTFVRPEDPTNELQVWEAAAATSAAPLYFKPYTHQRTRTSYIDGGLYHNNPVHVANRERKLLWPEIADKHPDMLLSIGTGQNTIEAREKLERRSSSPKDEDTTHKSRGLRRTLEALYHRFDNILDAEHTWTEFEADINNRNDDFPSPYVRFNLDLNKRLPPFDAKDKFQEFRNDVKQRLKDPDVVEMTREIACSLVASSFYFESENTIPYRGGSFMCSGYVRCKFEEGSSNLKALGQFLSKQSTPTFTPEFIVQDASGCTPGRRVKVKLTDKIISKLSIYGMLSLPLVEFEVPNPMASTTISLVLQGGCQGNTQRKMHIFFTTISLHDTCENGLCSRAPTSYSHLFITSAIIFAREYRKTSGLSSVFLQTSVAQERYAYTFGRECSKKCPI
ncbi:FabD/lysophospholipase-like protein [Aureobasidium sp. EXF-8845]|nr:FabD/lysophospholipase-like protein [Aureobasidium sp. EXF-8845]